MSIEYILGREITDVDVDTVNVMAYVRTVKPVYNSHPRDSKFLAVVDTWSFFIGTLGLQNCGRCRQVVVYASLTVYAKYVCILTTTSTSTSTTCF